MRERSTHPTARWRLPIMTAGLVGGILLGRIACIWWPAALAFVLAAALAIPARGGLRTTALALAAMTLGTMLGWNAYHPALPDEGTYTITGTVVQEVQVRENGQVKTILADVTLDGHPLHRSAYWSYYIAKSRPLPENLAPGATVRMEARLYHPMGADNPGGFDFREYLLQRGVAIGLYGATDLTVSTEGFHLGGAIARIRDGLSQRLMALMGPETGPYAVAMLLGERRFIPDEENAAFRDLGIAHILSVSGYHVGVLAALITFALKPFHLRRRTRVLLTILPLAAYCVLTGGDAPVIRATLLYLVWEAGHLRARPNPPLHTLCASATLQLLFRPALVTSASFQLSYGAMLGLLLIGPVLRRVILHRFPKAESIILPLTTSLAAQLGILPAQLYWFCNLPLLTLPANLFLLPFISGVMALYWAVLFLLPFPGLNSLVGLIASGLTHLMRFIIRTLDAIPGTSLWLKQGNFLTLLGCALMMVGLSVLLPRDSRKLRRILAFTGALLVVVSLVPLQNTGTTYIQFSVGEADAALLRDGNQVVVIDTGEDGQTLANHLQRARLSVDSLFITHLHSDHAGGFRALLDLGIPVKTCYLPVGATSIKNLNPELPQLLAELAATGTDIRYFSRGDAISLPNGRLTCLWPVADAVPPDEDGNHSSLVLLAELRGTIMLLTGDLTSRYEQAVAQPADILKAAHHGSKTSTAPAFLDAVQPQVVLLSCGNEARRTTLLERTGDLPLYDTNLDGAITIRFTQNQFTIEPYFPKEATP